MPAIRRFICATAVSAIFMGGFSQVMEMYALMVRTALEAILGRERGMYDED
jgi:hypothetical protein